METLSIKRNCGNSKRTIWLNVDGTIQIGCTAYTQEDAIKAISEEYTGSEKTNILKMLMMFSVDCLQNRSVNLKMMRIMMSVGKWLNMGSS